MNWYAQLSTFETVLLWGFYLWMLWNFGQFLDALGRR